ncbi:uncharacterized protein LOC133306627 [Gastrolobium bilobum]|uniref:uncharacterized protein LOC133306627 n=1 Tax=Gastrolobium bilobum TaxID=150636 RepID=UPI002AAF6875|nr:uncharacterized protein LOC133306627 [Gastrolobium bilobum]
MQDKEANCNKSKGPAPDDDPDDDDDFARTLEAEKSEKPSLASNSEAITNPETTTTNEQHDKATWNPEAFTSWTKIMFPIESAPFSVVYFDGVREINVGTIVVDHSLNFKKLLSFLSQIIGISAHQFTVYLATLGTDRKIPITSKVNLATVACQSGECYFFVKRSKRYKKTPTPANGKNSNMDKKTQPENVMLLRRDAANGGVKEPPQELSGFSPPILDRVEYENGVNVGINGGTVASNGGGGGGAVCKECMRAKVTGIDGGFHPCVNDEVIVGFRSSAGPVSRPAKNSGKERP